MPVAVPLGIVASGGIGALVSNYAAKKGAQAQTDAANAGIAAQLQALEQSRAILQPYVDLGLPASNRLGSYEQAGQEAIFGKDQYLRSSLDSQIQELQRELDSDPGGGKGGFDITGIANKVKLSKKIQELKEQRDSIPDNGQAGGLQAYSQAGLQGLQGQQNLIGINGPEAQQQAYNQIQNSPAFQSMMQQGENSILQNASATGGLRGGNVQGALAQFRPQLLNQLINQQYSQLGGLSAQGGNIGQFLASSGQQATTDLSRFGQASAAGQAAGATNTANNVSNLLQNQGAAQAGLALAQGQNYANLANSAAQAYGVYRGQQAPTKNDYGGEL